MEDSKSFWALVELFGHSRIAGLVTEAEIGGGALIRVDVPGDASREPLTKYYSVKAIYGITPVTEETARRMAQDIQAAPVAEYSLEREVRRRMALIGSGSNEDLEEE